MASRLIPVPPEVREVAKAALRARDAIGSGGTLRGVVLATALAGGYVVPAEVAEIRRWHQRHPDETAIVAGLYGGAPAQLAWRASLADECYLDMIAALIEQSLDPEDRPSEDAETLYRLYALLALTVGSATTPENVHDAWVAWTLLRGDEHEALVPFNQLAPAIQELDWPYVNAIRLISHGSEPQAAALSPSGRASRLPAMSKRVNRIDQRTLAKLHGAAIHAYEEALRRAGVKMGARARTKAARASLATVTAYTPTVLAAYGVTEDELLGGAFAAYATNAQGWLATAERQKLRAAADAVGLDPDEVEQQYGDEIEGRATTAGQMLAAVLGLMARATLSGSPMVTEATPGEWSGPVPYGVARDALAIVARGATPVHIAEPGPGPAQLDAIGLRLATNAGASNVETILRSVLGDDLATSQEQASSLGDGRDVVVMVNSWEHGDPARPFPAHEALDGLTWIDADHPEELTVSEEDGWLGVDEYEPGDHAGCTCNLSQSYEPWEG